MGNLTNYLNYFKYLIVLLLLVGITPTTTKAEVAVDGSNKISLDFEDVEIRNLVRFIAETTGQNFIVDSKVTGKVTVISPTPVSKTKALAIFESLLLGSGYAIVPAGDVSRIVPLSQAGKSPLDVIETTKNNNRPGQFVTRLIRPKHTSVRSIVPILKPLLSASANLSSYLPGNVIVLTESYGNVARLEAIINQLDSPTGGGSIELIPLKHADAGQAAEIIKRIFESRAKDKDAKDVIVIPEAGLNTLIVVADLAEMREITTLVKRLDKNNKNSIRSLDIVYLRHASAIDLSKVLNQLIDKSSSADENNIQGGTEEIRKLASFKSAVSIVADASTNSLIISAEPTDMVTLREIITKLDIRRLQVYLEALIMEVSADVSDQFGVEWRSADNMGNTGLNPFGGQTFGSGISQLSENPLNLPTGFAFGISGANITFRGQEYGNIGLLVKALNSNTNVNILSTPQLLTLDNQEAEIIVGDNIPFVTGTYSNDSGSSNPFQTIERQDVGLKLKVRPQISENGFVRLNIYQEISSVSNLIQASDIVTRKRSIRTTVVVPNDGMVTLGGLIRDDVNENHQEVPCLASMFGAGELFKSSTVTNSKTNLMIFIKPHIINTFGDIETITHEKYIQMRKIQLNRSDKGSKLVPRYLAEEVSIIPEKHRYSEDDYRIDMEIKRMQEEKAKEEADKIKNIPTEFKSTSPLRSNAPDVKVNNTELEIAPIDYSKETDL